MVRGSGDMVIPCGFLSVVVACFMNSEYRRYRTGNRPLSGKYPLAGFPLAR